MNKLKDKISLSGQLSAYLEITPLLAAYVLFGFAQASNEFRVLFLESQGLSATECGRVLAAAGLLTALSRPLAGALADKLRSRRVVYIGALLSWVAVIAVMLLIDNVRIASFALCAGIVPLLSVSEPVTYGMIEASGVNATLMNPKLDFSLIRVCLSAGYSLINFLYTPIVNRFGPEAPFYCTVVFAALMLLFSGTMRKYETLPSSEKDTKKISGEKLQFGRLFKDYYLITFVLLNFISALGASTQSYLFYLLKAIDLDVSLVGTAIGIRVLGEIIIMPLVPLLKKKISLPMLQALSCVFRMLQMIVFLTCRNPYIIMGGTILNGFSAGISLATSAVYLRMMAPKGLDTTTLSLSTVMMNFGSIIINLVGGIVVDTLGIFSLYRISFSFQILWMVLYFGTWAIGVYLLKKRPPVPMFIRNESPSEQ